jgi:hypothetical protein
MMARSVSWPRCPSSSVIAKITEDEGQPGEYQPARPLSASPPVGTGHPPHMPANLPDCTNQIRFIPLIHCLIPEQPTMELRI